MKKKQKKRKMFLILSLIFLLIIGNLVLDGKLLKPISHILKDITLPFYSVSNIKEKEETYELITNTKIQELEHEIEELKKVLSLNSTLSQTEYVNATTIYRNMEYWNETITVDKGSSDGILVGMPAVTKDGLIGRVVDTSNFTSTIELLCTPNSTKISVKIGVEEESIYGLLTRYDTKEKLFVIEGISSNIEMKEGSVVTTTGMGNSFPSGIFIGTTSKVEKDHFDLSQVVYMKSNVSFENISVVTILKRKDLMK